MNPDVPGSIPRLPSGGPLPGNVLDGLPMPALVTRVSDDAVVRVNPEFTAVYGHETGDVLGRPGRALHFVEADRKVALDAHAHGDHSSIEVRLRSASDECMWAKADVARFELDGIEDVILTTFHDIGERKLAERRLHEMARFPDMNPGPVVRLGLDGIVQRGNVAARKLFGDHVEGECFWDLCPGFSASARERVLKGGETIREDVRLGEIWLRLTVAHVADTEHVFVFGSDVTTEKAAERELAERARFPAMNPGAVVRLAADGAVIRANPAASRLFGRDSIQGHSWVDLSPGMDGGILARVRGGADLVQYEADIDGRCFSFTLRHEPVADQVFVYGSDVTELKSAERALAELARFPDMNPGPVCRLSREGKVLLANPAARTVFGPGDPTDRNWLDLVPAVGGDFWQSLLSSGEAAAVEATIGDRHFVLTHAPGPEGVFVFVYGSDVTREKEAERALRQSEKMATLGTLAAGVAHELNNPAAAAQRASEQLEQAFGALQAARMALGASIAGEDADRIVQELDGKAREASACPSDLDPLERSDLEARLEDWLDERRVKAPWEVAPSLVAAGVDIAALNDFAKDVGPENLGLIAAWYAHTHRVYGLLDEIRQGASRLVEIVGAMKAYSYLGQAPIQNVDVNEGIRNTLVILRSKLREGIVVRQELAQDLPRIEALGSELNQVWTNLIDNAADAMEGKGEIHLTTSLVDDRVRVEVQDDGPGIPVDIQSRVFDAFFTTKPPGKGTGLGLNTSYHIVEKHAGSIRIDSEPGRTRFTIELPIRRLPSQGGAERVEETMEEEA